MAKYSATLDDVFHALADPTRRSVVHRLGSGEASVSELAEPHDMALPSFMKHLRVLEDCDLIRTKKTGRVRTCQINKKKLAPAERWMNEQRALWEGRVDRIAAYAESLAAKEKGKRR